MTKHARVYSLALIATAFFASNLAGQSSVQIPAPVGFTATSAARQAYCEAKFVGLPSGDNFREHLRIITATPHPTGSAAQVEVGHYLVRAMKAAGMSVREHPYDVYLPQLTDDVEAHIVSPITMQLSNREAALPEDRFSGHPDLLNGWNAFSGSGDATAEVVYANYGTRADYRALDSLGISLEGKIVVARYGGNFRGFKVLFAEERGAAGVIMFNDAPEVEEDAYPEGPMLSGEIIQRGSVLTLAWTGDPLTPFVPALPIDGPVQVERLDPDEVGLHTIPVLPLGYNAAAEILSRMTGEVAQDEWQGGLDMPYRLTGGSELTVRVRVNQPKALTRATNVVGTFEGSEFPDEWIVLGAHYDPWGFGAIDPNGGTAMLLALADALGELADEGCSPRRSILIAHWDAEEYGVIGSTEWVEEWSRRVHHCGRCGFGAEFWLFLVTISEAADPRRDPRHAVPGGRAQRLRVVGGAGRERHTRHGEPRGWIGSHRLLHARRNSVGGPQLEWAQRRLPLELRQLRLVRALR
jgi:N-acetylated-alpha-linked acidic dipeptidase